MANLAELIKRAAMDAVSASKPAQFLYGRVIATDPLQVKVSDKLILSADVLVVPESLTDHDITLKINDVETTYKCMNALATNDKVVLIRNQGGQQYYILDKVVTT